MGLSNQTGILIEMTKSTQQHKKEQYNSLRVKAAPQQRLRYTSRKSETHGNRDSYASSPSHLLSHACTVYYTLFPLPINSHTEILIVIT